MRPIERLNRSSNEVSTTIYLQKWDECIGNLKKLEVGDFEVAVVLSCTYGNDLRIAFPTGSPEAETLKRELSNELIIIFNFEVYFVSASNLLNVTRLKGYPIAQTSRQNIHSKVLIDRLSTRAKLSAITLTDSQAYILV